MSSRTHGDWFGPDEDDTPTDVHRAVQRPISVAALLRREGHDGPSQEGMTRRTLTGVAAGAVMVFSAAVGSLLLHHGDTPTGAVAGSANGDVLAADGAIAGTSTPAANQQSLPTSSYTTTAPAATPKVNTIPKTVTHSRATANAPATTQAPVATTSQAPASSSAPASTAAPSNSGSTSTSTPSSTAGNSSSSATPSTSSSSTTSSNGGLLGTVTGTVTGVLSGVNNVANSTFSWFGN